jgi:hypothetical protein
LYFSRHRKKPSLQSFRSFANFGDNCMWKSMLKLVGDHLIYMSSSCLA